MEDSKKSEDSVVSVESPDITEVGKTENMENSVEETKTAEAAVISEAAKAEETGKEIETTKEEIPAEPEKSEEAGKPEESVGAEVTDTAKADLGEADLGEADSVKTDSAQMDSIEENPAKLDPAENKTEDVLSKVDGSVSEKTDESTVSDASKEAGNKDINPAEDNKPDEVYYDKKAFEAHGREKKRGKIWKIILCAVFFLMLVGYGVMTAISYRYFQANTIINGVDASFREPEEVQAELDKKFADYRIHVKLRNGEIYITPQDIGLEITTQSDVNHIKKEQNPFLWFMGYFQTEKNAIYTISYDEDKLRDYLMGLSFFQKDKMIAPENPVIEMFSGKPEIKAGTEGTTFDTDKAIQLIAEMIPHMDTELDLEKAGVYETAEYTADSPRVVSLRDRIERYIGLKLIYEYADIRIEIKPNQIYEMLVIDQSDYSCVVSKKKVEEFVAQFAAEHDTLGTERIFKTHDGKKVRLTSKNIGWQIDQQEEVTQLYRDICQFRSFVREPVFSNRAFSYTADGSDIGNTYVEVDLTYQRAYFYVDGSLLIDCDIISGLPSRGNDTPGGFYTVYSCYRDVVLRGPGYASHVDYWMPFNGGIGLHDASWQSKFGGDLFKTRGSHGCVNLEYDMAKTVYTYGHKGLSVVCYWRNSKYMVDKKDQIDDRTQQFFGL
jgi:hypothetical protein